MTESGTGAEKITIEVEQVGSDADTCVLTINRQVSAGQPSYYSSEAEAAGDPLAVSLLQTGHLEALL